MKSVKAAKVSGKKVILRADLDLPLRQASSGQVEVADDTRLKALLPTLKYLLDRGAKVIVIGHLGRPEGKRDPKLSLEPVAVRLQELLRKRIEFFPELPITNYQLPNIALLENLRFWDGEEKNDLGFAKKLAGLGDIFVNDAFAASHREHASIVEIPKHLPAYAGLRLEEEVKELGSVLVKPERPLIFIIGGAKTETKKPLVPAFAKIADKVLLGGLLMFSRELERIPNVVFPIDAKDAYDIGPKSVKFFTGIIKEAKTVVWNGPLGVWEKPRYARGTRMIAEELALLPGKTIAGGGDTIAALNASGLASKISYVSLGGGAMLEFLAGKKLPGLVALGHYD